MASGTREDLKREHNMSTMEEQAATVTMVWCNQLPEIDQRSPSHLWEETRTKAEGKAGGLDGKNKGWSKKEESRPPEKACTTVLFALRWREALTSRDHSAIMAKTRTASPRLDAKKTGSSAWNKTGTLPSSSKSKARAHVASRELELNNSDELGKVSFRRILPADTNAASWSGTPLPDHTCEAQTDGTQPVVETPQLASRSFLTNVLGSKLKHAGPNLLPSGIPWKRGITESPLRAMRHWSPLNKAANNARAPSLRPAVNPASTMIKDLQALGNAWTKSAKISRKARFQNL